MDRDSILPIALCLFGVIGLIGAGIVFPTSEPKYHHSVEEVNESEIPSYKEIMKYEDLSSEAQYAFRTALNSSEGESMLEGKENKPPEFQYTDATNYYYIQYGGEYYRIGTIGSSGFDYLHKFASILIALLSLGLIGIGAYSYGTD